MDKRGNRTQAAEMLAQPATTNDVTIASTDKGIIVSGAWADVSGFKESSAITASLGIGFVGDEATLTMGTGPDHGMYDVYIDGSLWQSFDGYAAAAGERNIVIPSSINTGKLSHDGPHGLEIRVRAERHPSATGNKVRFKQLVIADRGYTLHTIRYSYDKLARVRDARYAPGLNGGAADADLLRRYQYAFDLSGNRTQEIETIAGNAATTDYGYNAANQMISAGGVTLTYDNNGNVLGDGTNTYAWDRANRMRAVNEGDASQVLLTYDGLGNLVQQVTGTINPTTHSYLVDVNALLPVVVREQASYYNPNDNYTRHQIHGPRGIHYHEQVGPYIPSFPDPIMMNTQAWMLQDGLGSVRGVADPTGATVWSTNYVPFGGKFGTAGTAPTSYGFTGEQYSAPDLVYLRARHYNPALGIFAGLDPFEGLRQRPMSLNGYSWVEGNLPNDTDPSGRFGILALAGLLFIGALSVAVLQPIINNALCAAGSPYCLRDGDLLRNLNNICANIRDNVSNVAQGVGRLFGSGSVSNAQFLGVPSQGAVSSGGITTVTPTLELEYIPTAPRFPTPGGVSTITPTPDFEYVPTATPFPTPSGITPAPTPPLIHANSDDLGVNYQGLTYRESPSGLYIGVYVTGRNGNVRDSWAEFDYIDTNSRMFTEDKTGQGLFPLLRNVDDITQRAAILADWVNTQIIEETVRQIASLNGGIDTRPRNLSDEYLPHLSWFRGFRSFQYNIEALRQDTTLELWSAVDNGLSTLRQQFPNYEFSLRR